MADVESEMERLTELEKEAIAAVIARDDEIRNQERLLLITLESELEAIKQKGLTEEEELLYPKLCVRCRGPIGFFTALFSSNTCPRCLRRTCKQCRWPFERSWICIYCNKLREEKAASGAWYYKEITKKESPTDEFFGSEVLRKTIWRKRNNDGSSQSQTSMDDNSTAVVRASALIESDRSRTDSGELVLTSNQSRQVSVPSISASSSSDYTGSFLGSTGQPDLPSTGPCGSLEVSVPFSPSRTYATQVTRTEPKSDPTDVLLDRLLKGVEVAVVLPESSCKEESQVPRPLFSGTPSFPTSPAPSPGLGMTFTTPSMFPNSSHVFGGGSPSQASPASFRTGGERSLKELEKPGIGLLSESPVDSARAYIPEDAATGNPFLNEDDGANPFLIPDLTDVDGGRKVVDHTEPSPTHSTSSNKISTASLLGSPVLELGPPMRKRDSSLGVLMEGLTLPKLDVPLVPTSEPGNKTMNHVVVETPCRVDPQKPPSTGMPHVRVEKESFPDAVGVLSGALQFNPPGPQSGLMACGHLLLRLDSLKGLKLSSSAQSMVYFNVSVYPDMFKFGTCSTGSLSRHLEMSWHKTWKIDNASAGELSSVVLELALWNGSPQSNPRLIGGVHFGLGTSGAEFDDCLPNEVDYWSLCLSCPSTWIDFELPVREITPIPVVGSLGSVDDDNEFSTQPKRLFPSRKLSDSQRTDPSSMSGSLSYASVYSHAGGRQSGITITGHLELVVLYSDLTSTLTVKVMRAKDIAVANAKKGYSDPYAKVYIIPDKNKTTKNKTNVAKRTLHPEWNTTFQYRISRQELSKKTVNVSLWNYDRLGMNDFLGEVNVALEELFELAIPQLGPCWLPLRNQTLVSSLGSGFKGELTVGLRYRPSNESLGQGVLEVTVVQARTLPALKSDKPPDSFVCCTLLPDSGKQKKMKTAVVKRNHDPVWNGTFSIPISHLDDLKYIHHVELTVWNPVGRKNEFLCGLRLGMGTGSEPWQDASDLECKIWHDMLAIPGEMVQESIPLRDSMTPRDTHALVQSDSQSVHSIEVPIRQPRHLSQSSILVPVQFGPGSSPSPGSSPAQSFLGNASVSPAPLVATEPPVSVNDSSPELMVASLSQSPPRSSLAPCKDPVTKVPSISSPEIHLVPTSHSDSAESGSTWKLLSGEGQQSASNLSRVSLVSGKDGRSASAASIGTASVDEGKQLTQGSLVSCSASPLLVATSSGGIHSSTPSQGPVIEKEAASTHLILDDNTLLSRDAPAPAPVKTLEHDTVNADGDPEVCMGNVKRKLSKLSINLTRNVNVNATSKISHDSDNVSIGTVSHHPDQEVNGNKKEEVEIKVDSSKQNLPGLSCLKKVSLDTQIDVGGGKSVDIGVDPNRTPLQSILPVHRDRSSSNTVLHIAAEDHEETPPPSVPTLLTHQEDPTLHQVHGLFSAPYTDVGTCDSRVGGMPDTIVVDLDGSHDDQTLAGKVGIPLDSGKICPGKDSGRSTMRGGSMSQNAVASASCSVDVQCQPPLTNQAGLVLASSVSSEIHQDIPSVITGESNKDHPRLDYADGCIDTHVQSKPSSFVEPPPSVAFHSPPFVAVQSPSSDAVQLSQQATEAQLGRSAMQPENETGGAAVISNPAPSVMQPTMASVSISASDIGSAQTTHSRPMGSPESARFGHTPYETSDQEEEEGEDTLGVLRRSSIRASRLSLTSITSESPANYGNIPIRGSICFGLKYDFAKGTLVIDVIQAKDIGAVDAKKNTSDPYVKTYLLPDKAKGTKKKTKTAKSTINPSWKEGIKYSMPVEELRRRTLQLCVWNDRLGKNYFLGEVLISMDSFLVNKEAASNGVPEWYTLSERSEIPIVELPRAAPIITFGLMLERSETSSKGKKDKKKSSDAVLQVIIKSASNLRGSDSTGLSDPYVKVYFMPDKTHKTKQKSDVRKASLTPVWDFKCSYDVTLGDLSGHGLEITVVDHDAGPRRNDFLGSLHLNSGAKREQWQDASGQEMEVWQTLCASAASGGGSWLEFSLPLRAE